METENTSPMHIEASDIRIANIIASSSRLFIHTNDGRTVIRTISCGEVTRLQTIESHEGVVAYKEAIARLFNEKYREPQKRVELSASDKRFWENHMLNVGRCGVAKPDCEC